MINFNKYLFFLRVLKLWNLNFIHTLLILFLTTFLFAQAEHDLYLYTSNDGTTFGNPFHLVDSADVPSMTQDTSGRLICVFQNFKGGFGSSTWDKLGVVTSTDNGVTWSAMSILNISGLPGTTQRPFDPTIVMTDDNKYRLYFSYCPNNMVLDSTCDTYSALSTDFINYTVEAGNRYGELNVKVIDPTVVKFNSQWHYMTPLSTPPPTPFLGGARHATSLDGLTFTLIDSIGVGDLNYKWTGNLMNNGSEMRFYGFTDNVLGNLIWWSESTDGSSWGSYTLTNITGKDPAIYKGSSNYFLIVPKVPSTVALQPLSNQNLSVKIYPNPITNTATVFLENLVDQWSWTLYNAFGKVVQKNDKIKTQHHSINKGDLSAGIYFYHIHSQNMILSGELIVE